MYKKATPLKKPSVPSDKKAVGGTKLTLLNPKAINTTNEVTLTPTIASCALPTFFTPNMFNINTRSRETIATTVV